MQVARFIFSVTVILFVISCTKLEPKKVIASQHQKSASLPKTVRKLLVIDIIPFKDMPVGLTKYIFSEFIKIYPNTRLLPPIPIPLSAYYPARARYRADTLIRQLSAKTISGHVSLALTTKDISYTKDKFADYGIMGLSYCPGKACVASSYRLDTKNLKDQFFKIAIHELGHTQGLPHCPVKECFMRDAEGKNHTDKEKFFCPQCKKVLIKSGWLL